MTTMSDFLAFLPWFLWAVFFLMWLMEKESNRPLRQEITRLRHENLNTKEKEWRQ